MAVLLSLSLSGCSNITVTDHVLYGDEEPMGAVAVHTLANVPPVDLTEAQWDAMRGGMVCMSTKTIADFKAYIEEECSISNNCLYDQSPVIQAHKKALLFLLNELEGWPHGQ